MVGSGDTIRVQWVGVLVSCCTLRERICVGTCVGAGVGDCVGICVICGMVLTCTGRGLVLGFS